MSRFYTYMDSPVGRLVLMANDEALELVEFTRPRWPVPHGSDWVERNTALLKETRRQLDGYFGGRRRDFDLPLAPQGTPFQQRVWRALLDVRFGTTCAYIDIARRLGDPRATRAVGAANGRNPIPIIIPCHRVVGANGSLTGYGGGLDIKRFLLGLEGATTMSLMSSPPSALGARPSL
jgi:methylated-DNA-[protein]-cysteine S-methyltransferase